MSMIWKDAIFIVLSSFTSPPPAPSVHGVLVSLVSSYMLTKKKGRRMYVIDERVVLVSVRACGGWHHTRKGRGKVGRLALC